MAINKLSINIKDCYGITEFNQDFELVKKNPEYRNERVIQIYAPNGTMKTSLTKCFKDYKEGLPSIEQHSDTHGTKIIKIDDKDVEKEQVFVIESYVDNYTSPNIAKLLLNSQLKKEYEDIHAPIKDKENNLRHKINAIVDGSSKGVSLFDMIADSYYKNTQLLPIYTYYGVSVIEKDIEDFEFRRKTDDEHKKYSKLNYHILFHDKVFTALDKKGVKENIGKYFSKYKELLSNSKIFKVIGDGVFDHQNMETINKILVSDNFFDADHSITLLKKDGDTIVIDDNNKLFQLIEEEKIAISSNEDLKSLWRPIEDALDNKGNTNTREFARYIKSHLWLVNELNNLEGLRKKVIASYFLMEKDSFNEYIKIWAEQKPKIDNIREKAKAEAERWKQALKDFHSRFYIPYRVKIENNATTALGEEDPKLSFEHNDCAINKNDLLTILSEGEKRTLYLLNIIFDLLTLQDDKATQDKILVIDDIVDSFDYKNKHAILEYIYDVTKDSNIYLIMLTHSFDFYRSISFMFQLGYGYIAERSERKISLEKYKEDDLNPCKNWLKIQTSKDFISSMALIRNLCDYSGNDKGLKDKISKVLHYPLSNQHENLQSLYCDIKTYLNFDISHTVDGLELGSNKTFYDNVIKEADIIANNYDNSHLNLQDKVILAIALRLLMENKLIAYLQNKQVNLKDKDFEYNQTRVLINTTKPKLAKDNDAIKVLLDMVNIISANHIHINSFMYEPLLDIYGGNLIKRYQDLKNIAIQ